MKTDPQFQQFKLRMPRALKKLIEQAAQANMRSVSAEILYRLQV
jgi:hypothetical protein